MNPTNRFFTLLLSLLLTTAVASAQSIWTGAGTGDSWATDENWEDDEIPPATGEAIFGTGVNAEPASEFVVDVDAGRTITDFTFRNGVYHRFTGEDLHLADGGTLSFVVSWPSVVAPGPTFEMGLILEGADSSSSGSYTFNTGTFGRRVAIEGEVRGGDTSESVTLTLQGTLHASVHLLGGISDGDADDGLALVIETGAVGNLFDGATVINGATTYSGGTTVNRGGIFLNDDAGLGTGPIIWNGGQIRGTNTTLAGSARIHTFTQDFTWNGRIDLLSATTIGLILDPASGEVVVGNEAGLIPSISANSKTLTVKVPLVDGAHPQRIEILGTGGRVFEAASPDFSGGVLLAGGGFNAGHDQAFGTGTITLQGGEFSNSGTRVFANAVEWNGILSNVNSTLTFNGPIVLGNDPNFEPTLLNTNNRITTFNGVIADGSEGKPLQILARGAHVFNAANTFSSGVIIENTQGANAQNVRLGNDQALGMGTVTIRDGGGANGTTFLRSNTIGFVPSVLNIANNLVLDGPLALENWDGWNFSGDVTLGSVEDQTPVLSFTRANSDPATFTGVISDGGFDTPLVKAGTGVVVFANNNTLSGAITVEEGTLQFGNNGTTGAIGTAAVTVADGATLAFSRSNTATYANAITGEGDLGIGGTGEIVLTGTVAHEGLTTIASGATLRMNTTHSGGGEYQVAGTLGGLGTVSIGDQLVVLQAGGFISPGSNDTPGVLNLEADALNLNDVFGLGEGSFIFRLGSVSDRLNLNGATLFMLPDIGEGLIFDDFDFTAVSGFGAGTYVLFENFATVDNILADSGTSGEVNGLDSWLEVDGSNLVLTVIPEPATVAAILGLLSLGLAFWRRQKAVKS